MDYLMKAKIKNYMNIWGTEQDTPISRKWWVISGSASEPFLIRLLASSLAVEAEEEQRYLEENWVSAMEMGRTPNK